MANKKNDIGLMIAIMFASAVVSGSLVFFGIQFTGAAGSMSADILNERIEDGIEKYIEKKQQEAEEAQADAAAKRAEASKANAKNVNEVSDSEDHIYGNVDAKLSLIEYSDFSCPYCTKFHVTAKEVVDSYGDDVNWVYRHLPLSFHEPEASRQAMASECAASLGDNTKFWAYASSVFETRISSHDDLVDLAVNLGIDKAAFSSCLTNETYKKDVDLDTANGGESGVTGTPGTIVLNNETGEAILIEGAQPAAVFKKVIDDMLK